MTRRARGLSRKPPRLLLRLALLTRCVLETNLSSRVQSVPPQEYIQHILEAKFCPVCGGFSQWTPRLAEALYYECVPIILSPMMLP